MRNVNFDTIVWESVFTIENLNAIFSFYDVGLGKSDVSQVWSCNYHKCLQFKFKKKLW